MQMGVVVGAIIFYIATGLGSVPHYNIRIYKVYRIVFIGIFFVAPLFSKTFPVF